MQGLSGVQRVGFFICFLGFLLTIYLFAASRNDPSLRIAALVSATGLVQTLAAMSSVLLTGKDLTHRDAPDPGNLPPNSQLTQTSSTQLSTQTPADPGAPK